MKDCAVVIPAHRSRMTASEEISFRQCLKVFGQRRKIILVTNPDVDTIVYQEIAVEYNVDFSVEIFDSRYFDGIYGYNRLMLNPLFYKAFSGFDYILICQLDAFPFRDEIDRWTEAGYDYVGAPLFAPGALDLKGAAVGNGGFSLRKTSAFIKVTSRHTPPLLKRRHNRYVTFVKHLHYFWMLTFSGWCNPLRDLSLLWVAEDRFFSYALKGSMRELKVPTPEEALEFAFDSNPEICYAYNGERIPMAAHKWPSYNNFWKQFISVNK